MTIQAKLGIAALTVGSGAVATYAALAPKIRGTEISKLINDEFRYVLLDTAEGETNKNAKEWGEKWNSYFKNNQNNTKDIFDLVGWDKEQDNQLKDKLREKCKELAKKEVQNSGDTLYKEVTKYCVRDVTIEDHAKRDNLDLIKTDGTDEDSWNKVAKRKDKLAKDFKNLKITPEADTNYLGTKVKEGCKEAIKKHKGQDDYQTAYNSYKKVCVTEAAKEEGDQ